MKKSIITIFILLVTFITITPISATQFPTSAYQVPWEEGRHYVIGDNGNNILLAYVATSNNITNIFFPSANIISSNDSSNTWERYYFNNNTWTKVSNATTNSFNASFTISSFVRYSITPSNVIASTVNITNGSTGPILFQQAPFQLHRTPLELALEGAMHLITTHFGTILLVGLVVFGIILAIRLGVRGLRLVIR